MTVTKKLIEVALPLEAINRESAREKSIRHGHPSTLHLWWARRPLAACRAVLFASIVDDPSSRPDLFPTEEEQEVERQRLFRIIEELVKWENTTNETVLDAARAEIMKATDGNPPPVLDPFCGGGSIPLEAQRLGLEAHASDLNPVAVLITRALIEIPPTFAGKPPINPESREQLGHGASWKGSRGLAEDLGYYGKWIADRAFEAVGHLYPRAKLADQSEATVIAWIWARTVSCSNPSCQFVTPLVRAFNLATKPGKEASVDFELDHTARRVRFFVREGELSERGPTVDRHGARCVNCQTSLPLEHVASEGRAGRLGSQLMATVALGDRARIYLTPSSDQEKTARSALPKDPPTTRLPDRALGFRVQRYGLDEHADLFAPRQLCVLEAFADLVREVSDKVSTDAISAGREDAAEYAQALQIYLGLTASKLAAYNSTLCSWLPGPKYEVIANVFTRQAVSMTWDFAEANPFAGSTGDFLELVRRGRNVLEVGVPDDGPMGVVRQLDARSAEYLAGGVLATDPPYYDNIGYADLSDFFYIWLRRALSPTLPDLFSTVLTPKTTELIANPAAFEGDRKRADAYFETGMASVFSSIVEESPSEYPTTVFYAFKQVESRTDGSGHVSTGWETMLEGLRASGCSITGTWPIRTERSARPRGQASNALASSIVLVCRPRPNNSPIATRRELVGALRAELPTALKQLQHGNIAPVDLAQAAIGPGMAVFSRYAKVLEADGTSMSVRSALGLINQALDEILAEQEGDFDADTRFAVTWFDQRGFGEGPFGEADVLARAKDTSTRGLEEAGVLISRAGKVRLLGRDELPEDWDPVTDRRPTIWEAAQHLTRRLESDGGEVAAAELLRRLGGLGEVARELAYRLYMTCERKGWSQDALAYNALVVAWPEIARLVAGTPEAEAQQALEV